MSDQLIKATAGNHCISVAYVNMKDACTEAVQRQQTHGAVSEAYCRALIAGALMGAAMKNDDDLLTLIIHAQGPAKGVTVTADSAGHVKGYPHERFAEAASADEAYGAGVLTIVKDIGLKEPYNGQIPLVTGGIAQDITAYYAESEQIPTACAIGVTLGEDGLPNTAGGWLIQLLPDTPEEILSTLEADLAANPSATTLLKKYGSDPKALLNALLPGLAPELHQTLPVAFQCDCSEDKVKKALIAAGKQELSAMIEEGKDVEVVCDFCQKKYVFSPETLKNLMILAQEDRRQ